MHIKLRIKLGSVRNQATRTGMARTSANKQSTARREKEDDAVDVLDALATRLGALGKRKWKASRKCMSEPQQRLLDASRPGLAAHEPVIDEQLFVSLSP
jgi:hypothetical protein